MSLRDPYDTPPPAWYETSWGCALQIAIILFALWAWGDLLKG